MLADERLTDLHRRPPMRQRSLAREPRVEPARRGPGPTSRAGTSGRPSRTVPGSTAVPVWRSRSCRRRARAATHPADPGRPRAGATWRRSRSAGDEHVSRHGEPLGACREVDPCSAGRGAGSAACAGDSLTDVFVDLGMSPPCESYVAVERLESPEIFYPLAGVDLRRLPAGPAPASRTGRGHLLRLRLLLLVLAPPGWSTPGSSPNVPSTDSASDPRASWWRSPATTGTCCSTSWLAGSRCSASSRPPTSPPSPRRRDVPTQVAFLGRVGGATAPRRARCGATSSSPTTCSPTCPTSATSAAGWPRCSPTTAG